MANDSPLSVKFTPCVRDCYSGLLYQLDCPSAHDEMLMHGAIEGAGRPYAELEMANANYKKIHNVEAFVDLQGWQG